MIKQIKYKAGYKYQLVERYEVTVQVFPRAPIDTDYLALTLDGRLTVKKGYAWDGPSGLTIDTKNFMRGSLVHDALYQLMRNGFISRKRWRKAADKELRKICLEDGMSRVRAWWVYRAVRLFGGPAASKEMKKVVQVAP